MLDATPEGGFWLVGWVSWLVSLVGLVGLVGWLVWLVLIQSLHWTGKMA
jgi:hypothetical protein